MKTRRKKWEVVMDKVDVVELLQKKLEAIEVMLKVAMSGTEINSVDSSALCDYMALMLDQAEDAESIADELWEYMRRMDDTKETEDDMEDYQE